MKRTIQILASLVILLGGAVTYYLGDAQRAVSPTTKHEMADVEAAGIAFGEAVQQFRAEHNGRSPIMGTKDWPHSQAGPVDRKGRPYLADEPSVHIVDDTNIRDHSTIAYTKDSAQAFSLFAIVAMGNEGNSSLNPLKPEKLTWHKCPVEVTDAGAVTIGRCETIQRNA